MPTIRRSFSRLFLAWTCLVGVNVRADDSRYAERAAQFEREIRPVLVKECIKCHGEKKQEGGLRLDTPNGMLKGGDSGAAIVVGKPEQGTLINAIHHRDREMPPTGKLPDKTICTSSDGLPVALSGPKN